MILQGRQCQIEHQIIKKNTITVINDYIGWVARYFVNLKSIRTKFYKSCINIFIGIHGNRIDLTIRLNVLNADATRL